MMIIEQIIVGHMAVCCYLLGDEKTKDAVLIDPSSDFEKINAVIRVLFSDPLAIITQLT